MVPDPKNQHGLKMHNVRRTWSGKTPSWEGMLAETWIHKNGDRKWCCKMCGILNDDDASKSPACHTPAQEDQAPTVEEVLPPQLANNNEASANVPAVGPPSNLFQNWFLDSKLLAREQVDQTFNFLFPQRVLAGPPLHLIRPMNQVQIQIPKMVITRHGTMRSLSFSPAATIWAVHPRQ